MSSHLSWGEVSLKVVCVCVCKTVSNCIWKVSLKWRQQAPADTSVILPLYTCREGKLTLLHKIGHGAEHKWAAQSINTWTELTVAGNIISLLLLKPTFLQQKTTAATRNSHSIAPFLWPIDFFIFNTHVF